MNIYTGIGKKSKLFRNQDSVWMPVGFAQGKAYLISA